ncbi:hypothetical protein DSO57_1028233 [Entomophthora muscae]|uniref:Uncharacterized protein n=1 Tax=Entomophthora muscae TaxID=34485 RepID=A0ACC2TCR4_9FUNG|nr:hypothetical protein DSO57_1028233 [Entomophthora muscae]
MTPPLTPHPNCPMEPPTATKTTFTQLFGVLYITLTEMVDTMVPNSGPWSLLGRSSQSYGGHYPLAQLYSVPSQPMPLPMPGFLKDKVWVMNTDKSKLQPKKLGPAIILKVNKNNTYLIQGLGKRKLDKVLHHNWLQPWKA